MAMSVQCATFTDQVLLDPPAELFNETTVLSRAIRTGTVNEVGILLEKGCDPNLPCGSWGMRPLMIAQYISSKNRKQQIIQLLLQYGAVPSLADNHNRNCLMYACALKSCDSINTMLQASEYDFYASDCDGNTLLHLSAMVGDTNVLNVVLKYTARYRCDLNSRNKLSLTALLVAILRQRKECAVILHEHGASPCFTASDFQSILHAVEVRSASQVYKSAHVHDDLLLRVILDSDCIEGKSHHGIKVSFQHHSKPCLGLGPLIWREAEERSTQPSQNRSAGINSTSDYRQHAYCALDYQSQDTDLLQCATSPQSPSYMESIDNLLSQSYHVRRSASYRHPQVHKYDVDEEWVDTIRKYLPGKQCQCDALQIESTVKQSSRLARTISSPSNGGLHSTCPTQQASNRPKSLSRSTTSPHFFSQTSTTRKSNTPSVEDTIDEGCA